MRTISFRTCTLSCGLQKTFIFFIPPEKNDSPAAQNKSVSAVQGCMWAYSYQRPTRSLQEKLLVRFQVDFLHQHVIGQRQSEMRNDAVTHSGLVTPHVSHRARADQVSVSRFRATHLKCTP